jgi:acetyl/propionyl-CoA carboxylase alpha subunit
MFQKKFFWFGTEPVEQKALASYLRGEKVQDAANKNVAWAAHTGKGLLYFSKKATDKATPSGIFNLVRQIPPCVA